MKKFLLLILLGMSVSLFSAPKDELLEAPVVMQDETPNILGKIVSVNKKDKSFVLEIENVKVVIKVTKDTYIQFIGRKTIKKITFNEIAKDLTVSVNSVRLFNDLQNKKLKENNIYTANFLSFAN